MYTFYKIIIALLFYSTLPLTLASVLLTGKHRQGLGQRLGLYRRLPEKGQAVRIWLHAASVGEVLAAEILLAELRRRHPTAQFVVTTMTTHGREVARNRFGRRVPCLLAPLDVPGIADWALAAIDPDVYVCIETELWPVLLSQAARRGVPVVLANGRMSAGAAVRYQKNRWFFRRVLAHFDQLALISQTDYDRYHQLGIASERLQVTGNLKYDKALPTDGAELCSQLRVRLGLHEETEVFVAGSTHTGEEQMLLPVFQKMASQRPTLWLVAPRHLSRLGQVRQLLQSQGVAFELLSELAGGGRQSDVVLVDEFGELANLYGIGSYIFCGGSLVEKNGHNIMEAAVWDKPVFYGPSMGDFQDAVDLLESADAGFCVISGEQLYEKIEYFRANPAMYQAACQRAGTVARRQQGVAAKQAAMISNCLTAVEYPA